MDCNDKAQNRNRSGEYTGQYREIAPLHLIFSCDSTAFTEFMQQVLEAEFDDVWGFIEDRDEKSVLNNKHKPNLELLYRLFTYLLPSSKELEEAGINLDEHKDDPRILQWNGKQIYREDKGIPQTHLLVVKVGQEQEDNLSLISKVDRKIRYKNIFHE